MNEEQIRAAVFELMNLFMTQRENAQAGPRALELATSLAAQFLVDIRTIADSLDALAAQHGAQ